MIETSTRTVYRGEGARRWRFTKQSAYRDAALAAWWKERRCECDGPDFAAGYPGSTCEWHTPEAAERRIATVDRLVRLWMRRDRKRGTK